VATLATLLGICTRTRKFTGCKACMRYAQTKQTALCRNDSPRSTTAWEAIFVKPQQWPTPSESIAIFCVRKLFSCVTHLQSCAKVNIRMKKKKLHTVAKIKTQDYKNWRLQNLSTIATPPLNTATTLFNEHRSQRPFGTSDWQNILSAFSVVSISDDHVDCNRP